MTKWDEFIYWMGIGAAVLLPLLFSFALGLCVLFWRARSPIYMVMGGLMAEAVLAMIRTIALMAQQLGGSDDEDLTIVYWLPLMMLHTVALSVILAGLVSACSKMRATLLAATQDVPPQDNIVEEPRPGRGSVNSSQDIHG